MISTQDRETPTIQLIAIPAFVFFIGAPLSIILHEVAHFTTARIFGCDARLYAMRVTFTGTFIDQQAADNANLWITLAGPSVQAFSAVVGVSALCMTVRTEMNRGEHNSIGFWVLSLLTFSGLRWLQSPWKGNSTDEATISRLIGYPSMSLPVICFVVSIVISLFLCWVHYRTGTIGQLLIAIPSGIAGAALWAFVVGPAVLGA